LIYTSLPNSTVNYHEETIPPTLTDCAKLQNARTKEQEDKLKSDPEPQRNDSKYDNARDRVSEYFSGDTGLEITLCLDKWKTPGDNKVKDVIGKKNQNPPWEDYPDGFTTTFEEVPATDTTPFKPERTVVDSNQDPIFMQQDLSYATAKINPQGACYWKYESGGLVITLAGPQISPAPRGAYVLTIASNNTPNNGTIPFTTPPKPDLIFRGIIAGSDFNCGDTEGFIMDNGIACGLEYKNITGVYRAVFHFGKVRLTPCYE